MTEYVELDERLRRIVQGAFDDAGLYNPHISGNGAESHGLAEFAVDWATIWDVDEDQSDWLLEPLVARGRGHALYAPAKTGKSFIVFEAAAALATGRPFLNWPGGTRHHTGYIDYEMTRADLLDRLTAFGYGPDDDLSYLHYILLPSIPTLDTVEGAQMVVDAATGWQCEWVVIDTMGRAVAGDENDADTYRAFYRVTGIALKSAGIAYHRLDHSGKDVERGQRGSSAKNDDVDVVQRLTKLDDGAMRLEATHRRMTWVPERVDLAQVEDELAGTVSHVISETLLAPEGLGRIVDALDRLEVPLDASRRQARKALSEVGEKCRNTTLQNALKERKNRGDHPTEAAIKELLGTSEGPEEETAGPNGQGPAGTTGTRVVGPWSPSVSLTLGDQGPPLPDPPRRDLY